MRITFVSNYINHHQIPFCDAMVRETDGGFAFVQTSPMEEERIQMGWESEGVPGYCLRYYEETERCRQLIDESDVVLFGGCEEESYIAKRLEQGKPVIRISERLYREGQWKAVSPRGLRRKYLDHTRYRRAPVYLLCAGAYVPSDFHIVRSYPGKMFCWGYFPETRHYNPDELMESKRAKAVPTILWVARLIELKHPELAIETAEYLKNKGISFRLQIAGGGAMEEDLRALIEQKGLREQVELLGFQSPARVRALMEQADLLLFTSDRREGWGAVVNEAMNSGCPVIADHMIGSVPYLIRHGENGYVYPTGHKEALFTFAEKLVTDSALREKMGREAYATITQVWNAENAAHNLMQLIRGRVLGEGQLGETRSGAVQPDGKQSGEPNLYPCAPAPLLQEFGAYRKLTKR